MPDLSNNDRLKQIADALEELNKEVVFVGGAVIQLYSSDSAAANPATTFDVDCVIDVTTYREYMAFEKELLAKHFSNDTSEGAPICRYLYNGEKVDFMPKVDTGIGESNRWYKKGLEYRRTYQLDEERAIFIMPVTYYLASKLEALHSRGGDDYRGAKDFEDIVFVLNTCLHLVEEVNSSPESEVKEYLQKEFSEILQRTNIREEIESAMLETGRVDTVLIQMERISGNNI